MISYAWRWSSRAIQYRRLKECQSLAKKSRRPVLKPSYDHTRTALARFVGESAQLIASSWRGNARYTQRTTGAPCGETSCPAAEAPVRLEGVDASESVAAAVVAAISLDSVLAVAEEAELVSLLLNLLAWGVQVEHGLYLIHL